MKLVFVCNSLNEILFYHGNRAYIESLICQVRPSSEDDNDDAEMFDDSTGLMQFFSPLLASQQVISTEFGNPYKSITLDNGDTVYFGNLERLTILMVCETRDGYLSRKKLAFVRDICYRLVGPSGNALKPGNLQDRNALWLLAREILDKWHELQNSETSFLFDAVEKLNVASHMKSISVQALEYNFRRMTNISGIPVSHMLLLVGTKLLALYSKKRVEQIEATDINFLNILCLVLFAEDATPSSSKDTYESCQEDITSDDDHYSNPRDEVQSGGEEVGSVATTNSLSGEPSSVYGTTSGIGDNRFWPFAHCLSEARHQQHFVLRVFLRSRQCAFVPFSCHLILITPHVFLIVLERHPDTDTARSVFETLKLIDAFNRQKAPADFVTNLQSHIDDISKTCALRGQAEVVRALNAIVPRVRQIDMVQLALTKRLEPRVEGLIDALADQVRRGFEVLFLRRHDASLADARRDMSAAGADIHRRLRDYTSFMVVKHGRNLAPMCYYQAFAGLVYFCWVDRARGECVAPTLEQDALAPARRDAMWRGVGWCRAEAAARRHTYMHRRDADCQYLYRVLTASASVAGADAAAADVSTYELATVHLAAVPLGLVHQHADKIVEHMGVRSDAMKAPLCLT